jgi:signal transduction histidine kinase
MIELSSPQQFVEDLAHELRSPLAVVKEYCSLVCDGLAGPTTERQREFLSMALSRIDDMSRLLDDMLDMSKIAAGTLSVRRERATVDQVLCSVWPAIERRAAQKNVFLELAVEDGPGEVHCDVDMAGRTLLNLAMNAIKVSPAKGRVAISVEPAPDHMLRFAVADSRPGVEAEDLQEIFEQLAPGRACAMSEYGLGLSIARELAALNLGDLAAAAAPQSGSTFSFTLPRADRAALMLSASIVDQQKALDQSARFFLARPLDAASVSAAKTTIGG